MICADFLAGANLDHGDPEMLLFSMTRFFKFLPEEQRKAFLVDLNRHSDLDWPKGSGRAARPCVVRNFAAAGSTSRRLEVSIVRLDVEPGDAPQTISQPIWGRFRREPDYAVRRLPWTVAFPEEGRPWLSADLEGFYSEGARNLHGSFDAVKDNLYIP
jgi:hypothetical protein